MIYSHVMRHKYGIKVGSSSKLVASRHSIKKREIRRPNPGLLGTCRQIRDEMEPLLTKHFFTQNTFEFGLCRHDFELFRAAVKENEFRAIRSVRLIALDISDLLWTFRNFEHLNDLYIGPVTRQSLRDPQKRFARFAPLLRKLCSENREKVSRVWLRADEEDTSMQHSAEEDPRGWDSRDVRWFQLRFFELEIELNELLTDEGTN